MAKILIVEGDPLFREGLSRAIEALYPLLQVEASSDALEALETLRTQKVDLLLVDLELPVPAGVDLFEKALELGMDKNRVVILSVRDPEYLHERFPMGSCLA